MTEWLTVAALAAGGPRSLSLDKTGCPRQALAFVDLTATPSSNQVDAALRAAQHSLPLLVGVAEGPLDPNMLRLARALDLTLVPEDHKERSCVAVGNTSQAAQDLDRSIDRSPRAAVVLGHLLHSAGSGSTRNGLSAEATAYSTLLAGPEFARWLSSRARRGRTTSEEPPVNVERSGSTLHVTLQRPARRNAIDAALRDALVEALEIAIADPDLQVELSGAGPDFCSGGDLDEFGTATDVVSAYLVRLERSPGWLLHRLRDRARVQLHGSCTGAGIEVPAFASVVIAASTTSFALPELSMGLIPAAGGTVSIPRRIGRWRTAWMALSGVRVDARTALRWGLVDEVTAP